VTPLPNPDVPARGKRAILGPVALSPPPRLQPHLRADRPMTNWRSHPRAGRPAVSSPGRCRRQFAASAARNRERGLTQRQRPSQPLPAMAEPPDRRLTAIGASTASAPRPTPADHAVPPAGACADTRQCQRSAPASSRSRSSYALSTNLCAPSRRCSQQKLTCDGRHVRNCCVPPRTDTPVRG
jgi:hypothetical protein